MNGPAIIGQRLKEIREQRGLKSKDAAAALGMNLSTYNHYENGIRFPKLDTFYEICQFYDADPDYFFGLVDSPRPFAKQPTPKDLEAAWKSASEALEHAKEELYKMSPR